MSRALSIAYRAQLVALASKHRLTPTEAVEAGLSFAAEYAERAGLVRGGLHDMLDLAINKSAPALAKGAN